MFNYMAGFEYMSSFLDIILPTEIFKFYFIRFYLSYLLLNDTYISDADYLINILPL